MRLGFLDSVIFSLSFISSQAITNCYASFLNQHYCLLKIFIFLSSKWLDKNRRIQNPENSQNTPLTAEYGLLQKVLIICHC